MTEWEERGGIFGPHYSAGGKFGSWVVERMPGTDEWYIKFTESDGPYSNAETAMRVAESWEEQLQRRPLVEVLDLPVIKEH